MRKLLRTVEMSIDRLLKAVPSDVVLLVLLMLLRDMY